VRLLPHDAGRELGYTPYLWLIYIVPFALDPFWHGRGPLEQLVTLVALAAFLSLYFLSYWLRGGRLMLVIASTTALGVAFAPRNRGAVAFFIYAAAQACLLEPPRVAFRAIVAVVMSVWLAWWAFGLHLSFPLIATVFSFVVGGANIHYVEISRKNARLRLAQEEVARMAKIAERERIARDLHDLLGHTLSVIVLKSELASKVATADPARAAEEIRDVERISRQALQEVRAAVTGYRSSVDAELRRAAEALKSAGVSFEADVEAVPLAAAQEGVLAMAIREAVTNVLRHSGARSCRVRLAPREGRAHLEIADDGRGGQAPDGVGLASMRERIAALGGTLERRGDAGTSLLIELPLAGAAP
jgi:two-component system, NarL family, sensor histidine kinase DesK